MLKPAKFINPYYDLKHKDISNIIKNSLDIADAIIKAFELGYAQGLKAQKAEVKRRAKVVTI